MQGDMSSKRRHGAEVPTVIASPSLDRVRSGCWRARRTRRWQRRGRVRRGGGARGRVPLGDGGSRPSLVSRD